MDGIYINSYSRREGSAQEFSLLQIMMQSPQMHPRKYLRKMKNLFILETDKGIIFCDRSLSLPLLFVGVWPEWGFQDLTYYQVWIICKPGKALPRTCNNQILGIALKAKQAGERTAGFAVKTWNLLWSKVLRVWPFKDDQIPILSPTFQF